jgi:hypothetical protein
MVYADDVNHLGDNTNTIKKNTEALTDASKEVGLQVNVEKAKYMLISHHQNSGQNHNVKIANRSFEDMAQFKYLETTATNQNLIQEEIKRRLNCYYSIQNFLSSRLLAEEVKIRKYKTIILPVVLYECVTWSLTLRKEHRLRMIENRGEYLDRRGMK